MDTTGQSTSGNVLPYAAPVPLAGRINFRVVAFVAVLLLLVGFPLYYFVDTAWSGGIHKQGDTFVVDLKSMSDFDMDQQVGLDSHIPSKWRDLDGKRVILIGEMWMQNSTDQSREFDLVYSIAKCCFNGPTKIQHFVKAKARPGDTIDYYSTPVRVIGTLHVGVERNEAGGISSVYRLEVEKIKPVS